MKKTKSKPVTMQSKPRTLSLKFYDEQVPNGWEHTKDLIKKTDPSLLQILAICHDRDLQGDDIWEPSVEKCHYHVIIRCMQNTIRVKNLLEALDIVYRKDLDDELWKNHGAETVGNFSHMAVYLQHNTFQAIQDCKEFYEIEEIVSNLTIEEIKEIQEGYVRVGENGGYKKTYIEMAELDKSATRLGYNLRDFELWYNSLDFGTRCNSKMKTVRESYFSGVKNRVTENGKVLRVCIFIEGKPNSGKTYASQTALSGLKILNINGGGSGKFDNLLPSHDAIIIDDHSCPNLLNMTDNYMCQVYRRQSNNPFWCGQYLVVTSNLSFEEWLISCGIKENSEHIDALRSRFYVCKVEDYYGEKRLICYSQSNRGSESEQLERNELFSNFRGIFNETIAKYVPNEINVPDVLDFYPCEEITPFDIIDSKQPKEFGDRVIQFSTHERLELYKKDNCKLYNDAYKKTLKGFKNLGIIRPEKQLPENIWEISFLQMCAKEDIRKQNNDHKKQLKALAKAQPAT